MNATLGREIVPEYQLTPAAPKKKVLVVGGGPAGMEAARVAAQRGHEVVLYEKEAHLGGLMPVAAIVKDLETEELTDLTRYFETQLKKEKVTVNLKKRVTPEVVRAEKPGCPDPRRRSGAHRVRPARSSKLDPPAARS